MKTLKTLFVALFTVLSLNGFSQANDIIDPSNISANKLKEIFENAYMTISKVDPAGNYVAVQEALDIYVDIGSTKKYITYSVLVGVNPGFTEKEILNLMNLLASEVLMVSASYSKEGNNIWLKYDYWIEGGVTAKSIVNTEKQFLAVLTTALQKDTKKIMK